MPSRMCSRERGRSAQRRSRSACSPKRRSTASETLIRESTGNRSLVLFDSGDEVTVQAGEEGIRFLLVSGKPIRGAGGLVWPDRHEHAGGAQPGCERAACWYFHQARLNRLGSPRGSAGSSASPFCSVVASGPNISPNPVWPAGRRRNMFGAGERWGGTRDGGSAQGQGRLLHGLGCGDRPGHGDRLRAGGRPGGCQRPQ